MLLFFLPLLVGVGVDFVRAVVTVFIQVVLAGVDTAEHPPTVTMMTNSRAV